MSNFLFDTYLISLYLSPYLLAPAILLQAFFSHSLLPSLFFCLSQSFSHFLCITFQFLASFHHPFLNFNVQSLFLGPASSLTISTFSISISFLSSPCLFTLHISSHFLMFNFVLSISKFSIPFICCLLLLTLRLSSSIPSALLLSLPFWNLFLFYLSVFPLFFTIPFFL